MRGTVFGNGRGRYQRGPGKRKTAGDRFPGGTDEIDIEWAVGGETVALSHVGVSSQSGFVGVRVITGGAARIWKEQRLTWATDGRGRLLGGELGGRSGLG